VRAPDGFRCYRGAIRILDVDHRRANNSADHHGDDDVHEHISGRSISAADAVGYVACLPLPPSLISDFFESTTSMDCIPNNEMETLQILNRCYF